ncbi:hypothetical protein [uncultured Castellaniella sp.]|uniref:hypothetical protein n=1 Tax=uncultured Castellaniella sp. TaxID=647907 RepID=UPI00262A5928|nr:hypothetical protein [uncultured Castellaniella sp.]
MVVETGDVRGLPVGDTKALIASQRKLAALVRLITYDRQSALLSLGDLQGDALQAVRDYTDQLGEILEASQGNPNCG